jgi:hypothetical protein
MNKFSTQKPWALGLIASVIVTYGSFSAIASTFQHAAADAATSALCRVELPPVTVIGKHAALVEQSATADSSPAVKL